MAVARDQAARIVRAEPDTAEDAFARRLPRLRSIRFVLHLAEERSRAAPPRRRTGRPPMRRPARRRLLPVPRRRNPQGQTGLDRHRRAARARRRCLWRALFSGGRFFVSTDDAYVRANNTTLGARVAGHVAAILPRR